MIKIPLSNSTDKDRPVVVLGAGGMLGGDLVHVFQSMGGKVAGLSHSQADITDPRSIEEVIAYYKPVWVVNAAAYTNVDKAEVEPELAHRVNAEGPKILTKVLGKHSVRLLHFSTDQVLDGASGMPQTEETRPNPLNTYAKTKLQGESSVLENPANTVLRVQWLYGERKDRFSPLRSLAVFSPFVDQIGSPSWTKEVGAVAHALMEKGATGLFHYAHDDFASWFEVFQFVRETWGLKTELRPRKTAEADLPAARPLFSVLSNKKLRAALGVATLGTWKASLKSFLDRQSVGVDLIEKLS